MQSVPTTENQFDFVEGLINVALADFITTALEKRTEQIEQTKAYFKTWIRRRVDLNGERPHSNWFYTFETLEYVRKADSTPDYSKNQERYRVYGLTKAGNRYYNDVNRPLEKQLAEFRQGMVRKIAQALFRYQATELTPDTVTYGPQGIEGIYGIGDGRRVHFQSIMAGGWNIQCLHYRYLVKPA